MVAFASCSLASGTNAADPASPEGQATFLLRCVLDGSCLPAPAAPPLPIYLFTFNDAGTGGLLAGTRTSGNTRCTTARSSKAFPTNTCTQVLAFYSVSASDSIAAMPGNFGIDPGRPIHGSNGTVLANNWGEMLDGSIQSSLLSASSPDVPNAYWTFSDALGNFDGLNCSPNATIGNPSVTGTGWLASGANGCGTAPDVLCACY